MIGSAGPEFSRPMPLDRIGGQPMTVDLFATAAEQDAIAARLGIPAVTALSCQLVLARAASDPATIEVDLALLATVVQVCVISLEPFEAPVEERCRIRFVPAGEERFDDDPDQDEEIAYEGTAIDLGELTVEQLALGLDPFPRRPGAVCEDPSDGGGTTTNPFAVLAARRRLE